MLACLAVAALGSTLDRLPIPPPMPRRSIAPRAEPLPGTSKTFEVDGKSWTLFVPTAWKPAVEVDLAVHFHGAIWHAVQEHLDRGLSDPLLVFYPGEGSAIYQRSVADPGHFARLAEATLAELQEFGLSPGARVRNLDVTSFSAGYGAVREWVKQPAVFARLRRVILADSLYGSLDPAVTERRPDAEHVDVWLALAREAEAGRKTFVITVSEVATPTYASSSECAAAIAAAMGGRLEPVERGTLSATLDSEFPLRARFDRGRFHVWSYGGSDGQAHMTHARHIADVWKALDLAQR